MFSRNIGIMALTIGCVALIGGIVYMTGGPKDLLSLASVAGILATAGMIFV